MRARERDLRLGEDSPCLFAGMRADLQTIPFSLIP
jgi:hypothetical protein